MNKNFFQGKVLKKLTILYFLLVLLPIIGICIYIYIQLQQSIDQSIYYDTEQFSQQLIYDISEKINNVHLISSNISYNSKIQLLLSEPFNPMGESLNIYRNQVMPLVSQTLAYNQRYISRLFVFMENEDIPEGAGVFLSAWRVKGQLWYEDFIASSRKNAWFKSSSNNWFSSSIVSEISDTLIYIQKIYDFNGKYLGIVAVEARAKDFLLSSATNFETDRELFILDEMSLPIIMTDEADDFLNQELLSSIQDLNDTSFESDGKMYKIITLPELEYKAVYVLSLKEYRSIFRYATTISVVFVLALILSLIVFYGFIRKIFINFNKNIKIMREAVNGNQDIRIPVKRNDEMGLIAESFNSLIEMNNALIKDIVKKEVKQKSTQLKALQFQINPHFFYNTLDILSSRMVIAGHFEIAEAIADFGKMLRYNMNDRTMYTTIEVELQYLTQYIRVQKLKYDEKLKLKVSLPDELRKIRIIKFILQPIVENSIVHGFSQQDGILEININFILNDQQELIITIEDNGSGIEEDELIRIEESMSSPDFTSYSTDAAIRDRGIGLENINERLKLFYGEDYGLRMKSSKDVGTTTVIIIPMNISGGE